MQSTKRGEIQGDLNVGGIAGSMAMEYPSDPESETSSELSSAPKRQYALKAILANCQNDGKISAKYSFVGAVCGRMDLGLIAGCRGFGSAESENGSYAGGIAGLGNATIRGCFAKCSLSGKSYVGGIVGSGLERGAEDTSSTVTGCYSMVEITDCEQYSGAISGRNAGEFLENFFVSDALAGIDGQSYAPADDGGVENTRIYTRQNGAWEQADCESFGDYLTFAVSGTQVDIAAVTVLPVWWAWLALALIALAILVLLILLVRRLCRRMRLHT